jgi:hypothetical protein
MNRARFLRNSVRWLGASLIAPFISRRSLHAGVQASSCDEQLKREKLEKEFVNNWLIDLWDGIEGEVDPKTRVKLMEACGRGCFRRHQFKQDIASAGRGSVDRLIEAYKKNFEIWREGESVHIRYGEVSSGCYCPAAKNRPAKPGDLHCECTRMTHQTVFETALGRPFKVEVLESLRRGGKTCHFLVHLV